MFSLRPIQVQLKIVFEVVDESGTIHGMDALEGNIYPAKFDQTLSEIVEQARLQKSGSSPPPSGAS